MMNGHEMIFNYWLNNQKTSIQHIEVKLTWNKVEQSSNIKAIIILDAVKNSIPPDWDYWLVVGSSEVRVLVVAKEKGATFTRLLTEQGTT